MLEQTYFQTTIFFQIALPSGSTNFTFPLRLYEILFSPYAHHSLEILSLFFKYSHIYTGIGQFHFFFDVYCPSGISTSLISTLYYLSIFIFLLIYRAVFHIQYLMLTLFTLFKIYFCHLSLYFC